MDSASKTITVQTNDLDIHKSFSIALSNPQGGAELGAKVATITINDKPKGGGSLGGPLLMLFALAGLLRRRKAILK